MRTLRRAGVRCGAVRALEQRARRLRSLRLRVRNVQYERVENSSSLLIRISFLRAEFYAQTGT